MVRRLPGLLSCKAERTNKIISKIQKIIGEGWHIFILTHVEIFYFAIGNTAKIIKSIQKGKEIFMSKKPKLSIDAWPATRATSLQTTSLYLEKDVLLGEIITKILAVCTPEEQKAIADFLADELEPARSQVLASALDKLRKKLKIDLKDKIFTD